MNLAEVIHFRIPQFFQLKILGKLQASKKYRTFSFRESFQAPRYSKEKLQTLFKENPFSTQFPIFNTSVELTTITDWRKDYLNNKTSPIAYYGSIERQNFERHGDVKYIAELSRMEFMPYMAFYAVATNDKQWVKHIENILEQWKEQNPYLYSIHWTSGIEVAIRSVNLIYTHLILAQFKQASPKLDKEIQTQLTYNYHFLKHHLSLYSSANNHLMAELMGLNVIASYVEVPKKETKKWKQKLEEQLDQQVLADGVHMERCTRYHAEVTDQLLISMLFLEASKKNIFRELKQKLNTMFQFTAHVLYEHEETIFGDNDEGSVIHPYFEKGFSLYASQIASANQLFDTKYRSGTKTDFRNYLLFGEAFQPKSYSTPEVDSLFEQGGYGFWYHHEHKAKFSFDAGPIGDNLLAAHGHSDIFHFNFSLNGLPFLVDSGTYQYHSRQTFWRNYFRGISAHNTVSVNQKDHALNNGRMSWVNRPKTKIEKYSVKENQAICIAQTNAFEKEGIMHSRKFEWNKQTKEIHIIDTLKGNQQKEKHIEAYFHFHPTVQLQKKNTKLVASRGDTQLFLENEAFVNAELISGNQALPLGWFSNRFGKKKPSTVVKISMSIMQEVNIHTKIYY